MSEQTSDTESTIRDQIYAQDCEFYRHQDQLMWGRFQTASTIEGGLLAVLYVPELGLGTDARYFIAGGALLVFALCGLSLKDWYDESRHLERIRQFERMYPLRSSKWPRPIAGFALMLFAIMILNAFNVFLLIRHW